MNCDFFQWDKKSILRFAGNMALFNKHEVLLLASKQSFQCENKSTL